MGFSNISVLNSMFLYDVQKIHFCKQRLEDEEMETANIDKTLEKFAKKRSKKIIGSGEDCEIKRGLCKFCCCCFSFLFI